MKEENKNKTTGGPGLALEYLIKWGLPLALTILLVWYMFRKVNFGEMWALMSHGVDYWWILLAMGLSIVSHVSRAARWRIQLRSLGIDSPLMPLCCSIFGCYALNLIFPRLGEVWRCSYVARREKAPFTTLFGSMVADRVCDSFMVLALTLSALLVAAPAIEAFMIKYPVGKGIVEIFGSVWFWVVAAFFFIALCFLYRYGRKNRFVGRVIGWIRNLWDGFAALWKMKGKWQFLLLTLAIWGCYFIQLYVAFFAFDFSRRLCEEPGLAFGLIPCLVAFVLSSIGMAVPSNGGLGPWNIAVMFGLAMYGVTEAQGTAFSMLQWSGQTVMLILLGIFTMIYISRGRKKER